MVLGVAAALPASAQDAFSFCGDYRDHMNYSAQTKKRRWQTFGWAVRARNVFRCHEMSDSSQELEPKKGAAILALLSSENI